MRPKHSDTLTAPTREGLMKLILAVVILILAVALLAMWVLRRNRGSSTTQNSSEPITVPYRDNMPVSDNDLDPENDLMKTSVTDYLVYDMDVPTWRKIV
ncbi:MAG TPA: hypothetical protein VF597_01880, partial [Candidatus Saccharimonadales bacterium]